ncbi:MAG: hypothetical protein ACRCTZ_03715 [Sarcina sp.]
MTNSLKPIKLENIKNLSGKKDSKNNIYYYLDFKFNLHKMGNSANGSSLYRIVPINFDNLLLKTFSKKTFPAKGYSTLESNNIKLTLKNTFDEILRIKSKKETARKAYEKALKEGKIPVEEVQVEKETSTSKKNKPTIKKVVRKKFETKVTPKIAVDAYKKSEPRKADSKKSSSKMTGNSFDKAFGKGKTIKKNEDFKRDRHFEKNESFNFDKENKERGFNKDKSFSKDKPSNKFKSKNFDSKNTKKSFDKNESSNNSEINKFNKNSREFSKGAKEKNFDKNERFSKNQNSKSSFKKKKPTSKRTNY